MVSILEMKGKVVVVLASAVLEWIVIITNWIIRYVEIRICVYQFMSLFNLQMYI